MSLTGSQEKNPGPRRTLALKSFIAAPILGPDGTFTVLILSRAVYEAAELNGLCFADQHDGDNMRLTSCQLTHSNPPADYVGG
mgnify:CR=1 FL=1|jgi:hypothetical protein